MNEMVPIGRAKPALCTLVKEAHLKGRTCIITVDGEPQAQLGPVQSLSRKLTAAWRARRKNIRLNRKGQKRLSLPEIIREGRK